MRTAIIVLVVVAAALVGGVAGNLRADSHAAADLTRIQQEKEALQRQAEEAARRLDNETSELERVRADNLSLQDRLARLQNQLAAMTAAAEPVPDFTPELEAEPDTPQAATSRPEPEERRGRGSDEWRQRFEEMQNSEEWAARREEFATRARERIGEFVSRQLEENPDTASQERIMALAEYSEYTMELFQQMRATEDEAERERLREELGAARETMQAIVTQQQDQLLRNAAAEAGIRDAQRQEEFVANVRETLESPFFRAPEALLRGGGRRGGWGGGGFGGFGGGGFGGRGGAQTGDAPQQ